MSTENNEPSYMSFARANVRDGYSTSHTIVAELLRRIDQLERERNGAKP